MRRRKGIANRRLITSSEVGDLDWIRHARMDGFLAGLATAWQHGEVRATHRRTPRLARDWRTRKDPFERAWTVCTPSIVDQRAAFR